MLQIDLQLDCSQYRNLISRSKRSFVKRCAQEDLLIKVEQADDVKTIERIATEYDLCDHCDFRELNVKAAILLVKSVLRTSYIFPRIRSRICFLGSKAGYLQALRQLCILDRDVINQFQVQHICDDRLIVDLASRAISMVDNTVYDGRDNNVLAQAFALCGIFDAVVLDENDFKGLGYMRLCRQLKEFSALGYHPIGCDTPISVIYHELGHILDFLCEITSKKGFLKYYNGFSKTQIASCVSQYATTNAQEFFAEAFSEYMCNDHPREVATHLMTFFEEYYKNIC